MKAVGYKKLSYDNPPMDCCFHPNGKLVAAGFVDGGIRVMDCSGTELTEDRVIDEHKDSCRGVAFTQEGAVLLSTSADKSVMVYDLASGRVESRITDAHECAIERVLPLSCDIFASGDEDGCIKTWDRRKRSPISSLSVHTDFISDLTFHEPENCLLSVSGDGCLSVNDLKTGKVRAKSEEDDELSAVVVLKGGKKVVCGTQLGVLNIFSWGHFSDCNDRLPGHPMAVDAMIKLDEDTVITGSGDGYIRVLSIQPHNLLGVLAKQEEGGCDRIALSPDHSSLATVSYDAVCVWDTSCLIEEDEDDGRAGNEGTEVVDSSDEEEPVSKKRLKKAKKGSSAKKIKQTRNVKTDGFFDDLL